jgi:hypothetical protein
MSRLVEMLGGVTMRGLIATPDMTASPAEPQMQPFRADFQALLAT